MNTKYFADQLKKCLDEAGVPASPRERAIILGKMLDIPKQQAWGLLEGHTAPDDTLLQHIIAEFEVDPSFFSK